MSKVLILSAATGNGHNQAAQTLKYELENAGYTVYVIDPIQLDRKKMDVLIEEGYHVLATRLPKMYGKMYKMADHKIVTKGMINFLRITLGRTIHELVLRYEPDLLISTHPFYVNVVSSLKARGKIPTPFISLVTDYLAHRVYVSKSVDAYIVGSVYTKESLTEKGVPEGKIFNYGIPIRKEFLQPRQVDTERPFTLLMMGGGMGLTFMKDSLETLLENKHPMRIIVVCGHNEKLRAELKENFAGQKDKKEILILGFTSEISQLMDQSDLIITKPGGLTVTEAMNKNVPILIPFYIPGQEEENTEVLVKAGVATRIHHSKELNPLMDHLIEHPEILEDMRSKAREITKNQSTDSIVHLADRMVFENLRSPQSLEA